MYDFLLRFGTHLHKRTRFALGGFMGKYICIHLWRRLFIRVLPVVAEGVMFRGP